MPRSHARCLILLVTLVTTGCERPTGRGEAGPGGSGDGVTDARDDDATYVFHDRQDARLEYVYVLRGGKACAQVAEFPGYAGRRYFARDDVPADLRRSARALAGRRSELEAAVPGGPWYCSVIVRRGKAAPLVMYRNENESAAALMGALRDAVTVKGALTKDLPASIAGDRAILNQLGL
jgi:hypothetical protein